MRTTLVLFTLSLWAAEALIGLFFGRVERKQLELTARVKSDDYGLEAEWLHTGSESPVNVCLFLQARAADSFPSATAAKKCVRKGLVLINDLPATTTDLVRSGDRVQTYRRIKITGSEPEESTTVKIEILWEDAHIAVVNKPRGLPVFTSLKSALLSQLSRSEVWSDGTSLLNRPQPVHRLDTQTGGLILVAKSKRALQDLSTQFSERRVEKEYLALALQCFSADEARRGSITQPLSGQSAHTDFEVLEEHPAAGLSLVRLKLHTGRTHQARRHLAHIGHPVLHDQRYGCAGEEEEEEEGEESEEGSGPCPHCLWSTRLVFAHPFHPSQIVDVSLPRPKDIHEEILAAVARNK
jgi:RluA family pseudouridine synthase